MISFLESDSFLKLAIFCCNVLVFWFWQHSIFATVLLIFWKNDSNYFCIAVGLFFLSDASVAFLVVQNLVFTVAVRV